MYYRHVYMLGLKPFIFACLHLVAASEAAQGSVVIYGKLSWKKAFDQCTGKGDGFSFPLTGNGDLLGLQLWLPIQKSRYPTWKWLDDLPVDESFDHQNWRRTMNCGAFHLRDGLLEADECNRKAIGALCDATGKYICKDSDAGCFVVSNRTFTYQCAVNNWYEAKHICKQRGLVLAMVRSPELMKELKILYKNLKFRCMRLWIGLRREDWYLYSHSVRGENTFPMKWASQQPSPDGNCAVQYTGSTGSIQWKTEYCGAEHHWRCHHVSTTTEETQENMSKYKQTHGLSTTSDRLITEAYSEKREEGESQNRPGRMMTGLIVGVTVPIFIICIFAIICLYIKMKRNRESSGTKQSEKLEEEKILMAANTRGPLSDSNQDKGQRQVLHEKNPKQLSTDRICNDIRAEENEIKGLSKAGPTPFETQVSSNRVVATSAFNRTADLVMKDIFSSKGGLLNHKLSDIRLKVQEGTIPESEVVEIICQVHSDMEAESYQLSSEYFLVVPVVELQGLQNGVMVEIEFEYALKTPNNVKAFKASISDDGKAIWTTDVKYDVVDRKLVIHADDTPASYTFALSKRENVDEFYNGTAAMFYKINNEEAIKQKLSISVYLIRSCYNLSDYLKYLHGQLDGNETCMRLKDVYTKSLITGVGTLDLLFEWSDPTWKEREQEGQYVSKEFSMDELTRNCNGVKIAEYHLSRNTEYSMATEFPMHFVIRNKDTPNTDPFLDLEHLVQL